MTDTGWRPAARALDAARASGNPTLIDLTQSLIGCAWGRAIALPDDLEPCPEPAERLVVLHRDAPPPVDVRLCARHVAVVEAMSEARP